jgi:uncharacterized protein (DUF58 family)
MKDNKKLSLKLLKSKRRTKFTTQGKRYALLMIAILLAALNTGNNLLYLILSFMIASIIFSRLLIILSNKKLQISLQIPEDIYAKKQFLMILNVKNNKKWISSSPQIFQCVNGIEFSSPPFIPQIKAGQQMQCKMFHTFQRRGVYKFRDLLGQSTYPSGIFTNSALFSLEAKEIVVYPPIKPLKDFYLNGSVGNKALESFITGGSFSLYNIRDYIPGDEARFLHWKASAKLSKLMTKEFVQEEQKKVSLLLDTAFPENLDNYQRENFEERVSLAASLLFYFISHDYFVRMVTSGHAGNFGWGALHLHKMLKQLAMVEADSRDKPDLVKLSLKEPDSPYLLTILISYRKANLEFYFGRRIWQISHVEAFA